MRRNKGYSLITVIFIVAILLFLVSVGMNLVVNELKISKSQQGSVEAYYMAEAGIREALWRFQHDETDHWKVKFEQNTLQPSVDMIEKALRNDELDLGRSYEVTAQSLNMPGEDPKVEIISIGYSKVAGGESKRKIKVKAYKALSSGGPFILPNAALFAADETTADDDFAIENRSQLTISQGGIFSNGNVILRDPVNVSEDVIVRGDLNFDVGGPDLSRMPRLTVGGDLVCDRGVIQVDEVIKVGGNAGKNEGSVHDSFRCTVTGGKFEVSGYFYNLYDWIGVSDLVVGRDFSDGRGKIGAEEHGKAKTNSVSIGGDIKDNRTDIYTHSLTYGGTIINNSGEIEADTVIESPVTVDPVSVGYVPMPPIDFNSASPNSLLNRANAVYTESEFDQLLADAPGNKLDLSSGITYVQGNVHLGGGGETIVANNSLLVIDGNLDLGGGGSGVVSMRNTGSNSTGLVVRGSIDAGGGDAGIEVEGLVYALDSIHLRHMRVVGGVMARRFELYASPSQIVYRPENYDGIFSQPAYSSPVVIIEHWEEEY
ncbi:MAG TPA: hypothetical protein VJB91_01915 [Patescibacteria group bacterium]|nr:hypothetical protein [Patescibacteria group bacterium]